MNNSKYILLLLLINLCACQNTYENLSDKHLSAVEANVESMISVNQVGYYIDGPKVAYLSNYGEQLQVKLVDFDTSKVVETLAFENVEVNNPDLPQMAKIDFSHINKNGRYVLVYKKVRSAVFTIDKTLYRTAITSLLRSFTLQRCGQSLNDKVSNLSHKVCHLDDSQLFRPLTGINFPKQKEVAIDTTGGWHDAGDFGKYVTTTTVSIGRILSGFLSANHFMSKLQLSLKDHSTAMPDVLTEMKYGLTWLLKMQHESGGIYRKVAGKKWPSLGAPNKDLQQRFVYGVSTDDTAKFAAVMALAARVYQVYDDKLSLQYQKAAELSWQYLLANENFMLDWQKKDDSGSGPYKANATDTEISLNYDNDDRLWAAAELYLTTKKNNYLVYINQNIGLPLNVYEWKDPAALGKWHLYNALCQPYSEKFCSKLHRQFIDRAELALQRSLVSDYAIANDKFIWGSNKLVAEEGLFLLIAYQLTNEKKYAQAAIYQADYILGANPFSLSYVSGIGENSVKNVSHIFARGEDVYIPGLLVGGPNKLAQANVAPKNKGILSYIDNAKSYAVNEYAIDYNASLISLLIELRTLDIKE